jgi:glycosyltransferase involved in cell wall biosynthesis
MSLHKETISVIIPNHNYGRWAETALDSVLDNYFDGVSVYFIDDGSKDNSAQIVYNFISEKYENISNNIPAISGRYKDSQMKINLISKNDASGPSIARNIGIMHAFNNTDYFMFLDCDDIYLKNKIKKSYDVIKKFEPTVGCVYSDYINLHIDDNIEIYMNKEPFSKNRLLEECIIPPHSLVPKYVFEKIGMFDEQMRVAEDYDLWIRMSKYFIGYHIAEPLVKMRVGSYNSSHTVSNEIWIKNWHRIREKLANE